MSKNKINNKDLLNAIRDNSLMIGINTYYQAIRNLNKVNIELTKLTCGKHTKSEEEFLNKQFDNISDSAYGSVVDALSQLTYLYDTNNLTYSGRSVVRAVFKYCMSKKDLRPIIERACKKSKKCSLYNLYKRYKKKVKVK